MQSNSIRELELTENNSHNTRTNIKEIVDRKKESLDQASCLDKVKMILKFVTVEPFLICYIIPIVISSLAVQKFKQEKACRADLNYSEEICSLAISGEVRDNITTAALNSAQKIVADINAWCRPLQNGIPAIAILFVGAWSDKTGNRKALMLCPILGELISAIGLLFATYFFIEWPLLETALIEALPAAFTGGLTIAIMGSFSYIADVTTVESRTYRIGVVVVIVNIAMASGTSIGGILTEAVGYYGVFGITISLNVLAFLLTYFIVHDVKRVEMEGTLKEKVIEIFHPKHLWATISLLFTTARIQLIQIVLIICALIVIMGPRHGEADILVLYVLKKYNMENVEYSFFSTYSTLMGIGGTAVAISVFSKYLKMHDSLIGIIATMCKVASSFVYSLAPTKAWFYSGPAFDFFSNSGVTAIKSLGTKVVDQDQVDKMCSLIGFVDSVVPMVYVPLYSKLYSATLDTFPGACYFVGGLMTVPAFFIFTALYRIQKRQARDQVTDPDAKKMHAHENAVAVL